MSIQQVQRILDETNLDREMDARVKKNIYERWKYMVETYPGATNEQLAVSFWKKHRESSEPITSEAVRQTLERLNLVNLKERLHAQLGKKKEEEEKIRKQEMKIEKRKTTQIQRKDKKLEEKRQWILLLCEYPKATYKELWKLYHEKKISDEVGRRAPRSPESLQQRFLEYELLVFKAKLKDAASDEMIQKLCQKALQSLAL